MSWDGYFVVDDLELINVARTEALLKAANVSWFKPVFESASLGPVLEANPAARLLSDPDPWDDDRRVESSEFYGVYPLDITPLSNSTLVTASVERITTGTSTVGRRYAGRSAVFSLGLYASTQRGAEYGVQWLKRTLLGRCAAGQGCGGVTLGYLSSEPLLDRLASPEKCGGGKIKLESDPLAELRRISRFMRNVEVASGVQVTSRRTTSDGWSIWTVSFTLQMNFPVEHGMEVPLLEGWRTNSNPWAGGAAPAGAGIRPNRTVDNEDCPMLASVPIFDPLRPLTVAPIATRPNLWGGYTPPDTWSRSELAIPPSLVSNWAATVPVIRLVTGEDDVRNIRMRFYADVAQEGKVLEEEECNHLADYVITYIPQSSILTIDPFERRVYVETPAGVRRRSDSLLVSSQLGPVTWPELGMGIQHVVALDLDPSQPVPYVELALMEKYA